MLKWLSKLVGRKKLASTPRSEADATTYLNALRERELSLGSALLRGEKMTRAPGQTSRQCSAAAVRPKVPAPKPGMERSPIDPPTRDCSEDVSMSLVVGAAMGSAAMGYLVGGSIAGGLIGEALSESVGDSATSNDYGE
jgi:hypothetical protein